MKKFFISLAVILVLIFVFFYLYKEFFFETSIQDKNRENVNYEGNFREKDKSDLNFNNSIISGVVVKIKDNYLYISPFIESNEQKEIFLDEDIEYFRLHVDSNSKIISKDSIEKSEIKVKDSIVIVPKSSKNGQLDFTKAKEIKIIFKEK